MEAAIVTRLRWRTVLRYVAPLTVLVLALALLQVPPVRALAAPAADVPNTTPEFLDRPDDVVSADPLPTVQLDGGIVWAQAVAGSTVYAGGSFTGARSPGAATSTPRQNLLAYDITTGALVTTWSPQVNGTVRSIAVSPDGSRIYVGGSFTKAWGSGQGGDGSTRWNLAAFDRSSGRLLSTFQAAVGGSYVTSIVAYDSTVYIGGLITAGNGQPRKNLMAFNTSGQLLGWAPTTDLQVDAMVKAPGADKLIVGGRFATVNGTPQRGVVALSPTDGSLQAWEANSTVKNGDSTGRAGVYSLSADAKAVYGSGWVYSNPTVGNLEGVFSAQPDSGAINWINDCHGDHYSTYSDGSHVYAVGHPHACSTLGGWPERAPYPGDMRQFTVTTVDARGRLGQNTDKAYFDWAGTPGPSMYNTIPDWVTGTVSGLGQAGWSVVGTGDYVAVGGEFRGVNGRSQYGLVRFGRNGAAGTSQGPRLSAPDWTATATSPQRGVVKVQVPSNWDRDNRDLTYRLLRGASDAPVDETVAAGVFWKSAPVTLTDRTAPPGESVTYRVRATDRNGNAVTSAPVTLDVSSTQLLPYANRVVVDDPTLYWRLNSSPGAVPDLMGRYPGTARTGTGTATGALTGDSDRASTFNGTTSGFASSDRQVPVGAEYTIEAWFRTSSLLGGKIAGYGNAQSGASTSYDRHIYVDSGGRVTFGAYDGATRTVRSPNAYRDGQWHHVVATQSAAGMALYVDGQLVGSNTDARAQSYLGYWRVGGDNLDGWPNRPTSRWLNGAVDDFAVYPRALSAATVTDHYDIGKGAIPPTAAFEATMTDQSVSVDASTSFATSPREIASYSWDFGDGSAGLTGVQQTHAYAEPGTYTVTLTITDTAGAQAKSTRQVIATSPHQPPTAVIDATTDGLTARFSSAGSSATDGASIESYEWQFGDGQSSTQANPTHRYAAAGTYTATLRVTDSKDAQSGAAITEVTVTHAPPKASFTVTSNDKRVVAVDASASSASDGDQLTYVWSWGDGSPDSTGQTATHTYASDGDVEITLTVTDEHESSDSTTRTVSVSEVTPVVRDRFERTQTQGWGPAEIGGTWSGTTRLSVQDGTGVITLDPTWTIRAVLPSVSVADSDSRFKVTTDKLADGNGVYVNYGVHQNSGGEYRLRLRIGGTGAVNADLTRYLAANGDTMLANRLVPGYTHAAGRELLVRLETGTANGQTTLRAKVWPAGDPEPTSWLLTATDGEASLQGAGGIAVSAYGTRTITNGTVRVLVDDLLVR